MTENCGQYIFKNKRISDLTYIELLKHCSESIDEDKKNDIQPHAIENNSGVFYNFRASADFPYVSVSQIGNSIILSCPCNNNKTKLCEHQALVLYTIINISNLRVFYDEELRYEKIKPIAEEYGLEDEINLDYYFKVKYTNKSLNIEPKIKELIKINHPDLKQKLIPQSDFIKRNIHAQHAKRQKILVISKHKYYNHLNIALYEGNKAKNGKIKNPVIQLNPENLIWKTEDIKEAKFYAAVLKFQNNYSDEIKDDDFQALKMIVDNPLNLDVFLHDKEISENVQANSIFQIDLGHLSTEIELSVFKKEPFYEITGGLWLEDSYCPFKNVIVRFNYFIKSGNKLHLISNPNMQRVLDFFKSNNEIILVHQSKYEEFRQNILQNLEHKIHINYSFIKPATQEQIKEKGFNRNKEKIIYLSDVEDFIYITPVIKYGNVEIPVFSRRQVFDSDQNGNVFKVDRDYEEENRFTSELMKQHPEFEEQLQEFEYFYLHKDKFLDENWFLDTFEEWKNNQITILGFNNLKKNRLNANKAIVSVNIASGIDWFNTELSVKYGKQTASLKELYKAVKNRNKYVRLDDGTKGILPIDWISKIARYFQLGKIEDELIKIPKSNFSEIPRLFDTEVLSEEIENELKEYSSNFLNTKKIPAINVPNELKATLRNYQKEGLSWLNFLDKYNFGACLADDMGLGKTIQIIAFILLQRQKQKTNTNLIIVPTSLLFNWQAEVNKFAPSIKIWTHYGVNRSKSSNNFSQFDIVLTTYGILLSDIRILKEYSFNYIILDESQAIKNPNSERYKAARLLKSRNRIVMTGTPIENNTFDIYGQLSFACPGLFGSKEYFRDIYSMPIDKFENTKRAKELQKKIKPFILRRTKKQVAKELPDKTEMVYYCEMGDEQRKVYNTYEKELLEYLNAKDDDGFAKDSMHVLTGITKLRQICNSPSLLKDEEHYGDSSAKIDVLMEQIENKSRHHKILVFSQFVSMLDLIKKELINKSIPFEYLTGQTKDRESKVKAFQQNDEVRVFLISLKAGGTGLNLTQADYVYIIDPWWNPAVENQAIDRCYRIGQKKNVIAVRLICPNTIEEKIMNLQKSKKQLANDLITTNGFNFKSLSRNDLIGMLK